MNNQSELLVQSKMRINDISYIVRDLKEYLKNKTTLNVLSFNGISNCLSKLFPYLNRMKYKDYFNLYKTLEKDIEIILDKENHLRISKIIERGEFNWKDNEYLIKYIKSIIRIVFVHNSYIGLTTQSNSNNKTISVNTPYGYDYTNSLATCLFDLMRDLLHYIIVDRKVKNHSFEYFITNSRKRKQLNYYCHADHYIRRTVNNYIDLARNKQIGNMFAQIYLDTYAKVEKEIAASIFKHHLKGFLFDNYYNVEPLKEIIRIRNEAILYLKDDKIFNFIQNIYKTDFIPAFVIAGYCHQLLELFIFLSKE